MPTNQVELAEYICEVGGDLIPLAKHYQLDSTAHCLELAVACAAEIVKRHCDNTTSTKPLLVLVKGEMLQPPL